MKTKHLLTSLVAFICLTLTISAQNTYVPDDNFEQALIDLGYDSGPLNDSLPTDSIISITVLDISSKSISDLTGIKDFSSLEELYFYNNSISEVDLSANTNLKILQAQNNNLTQLDLSLNIALTILDARSNQLTELNIQNGNNSNLSIDVTGNPNLLCIQVDNPETAYNNSNWDKNAYAGYSEDCSSFSPQMTYVPDDNFEQALIDLGYDYGELNDSVPTHAVKTIQTLSLSSKNISTLTGIEDFSSLENFYCSGNQISEIELSKIGNVKTLEIQDNNLVDLDLSQNIALNYLNASNNQLTGLNLSNGNNSNLSIDVRYNTNLFCIQVDDTDAAYGYASWYKNTYAGYSEDCSNYEVKMIYVPDDSFEQALIDLNLDFGDLDDSIPEESRLSVTSTISSE